MTDERFVELFTRRRRRRVRVSRLPGRGPPAAPRAAERGALPRARLQRGGDDHDAVRHGGAERDEPLPPRASRRCAARAQPPAERGSSCSTSADEMLRKHRDVHPRAPRGHARDPRLDLEGAVTTRADVVLCLNGGSSSLKFARLRSLPGREERRLVTGAVEGIGTEAGRAIIRAGAKETEMRAASSRTPRRRSTRRSRCSTPAGHEPDCRRSSRGPRRPRSTRSPRSSTTRCSEVSKRSSPSRRCICPARSRQ